ncbi:MAG: hypothetical protein U0822_18475 [Anaerolineae bacterium]
MQVGYGTWLKGISDLRGRGEEPVAACGAWTADDTYEVRVAYYESEVSPVLRLHFTGDDLHLEVEPNVSWGSTDTTTIIGHTAG